MQNALYAEPRDITRIEDCYFYHSMDIPGHGPVKGEWDLRSREAAYLGNINLAGKRVLEIGPASGYLSFSMEKMGASVVGYELSDKQEWDVVPMAAYDWKQYMAEQREHIRRLNNGYWFAHRAFKSSAKVVYGSVYEIPDDIGMFDVCTFGSVVIHLRDPFLALQRASSHVRDTIVVTDTASAVGLRTLVYKMWTVVEALTGVRMARFLPNTKQLGPLHSWWTLTPRLVSEFLHILGFPHTTISFHRQPHEGKEITFFTVVGRRNKAAI